MVHQSQKIMNTEGRVAQLACKSSITVWECLDLSNLYKVSLNGFPSATNSQYCCVSGGCRSADPAHVRQPFPTTLDKVRKALLVI